MGVGSSEFGISVPASPASGLRRMDGPVIDLAQRPKALGADNIAPELARPVLSPDSPKAADRDPFSYTPEEYRTLDRSTQDRVALSLMRQVPWEVLESGRQEGEETAAEAQIDRLGLGFELRYPFSIPENDWCEAVDGDLNGRPTTRGYQMLDALDEEMERLDMEKHDLAQNVRSFPRRKLAGLKLARYDRWRLQEQIRQEREREQHLAKAA